MISVLHLFRHVLKLQNRALVFLALLNVVLLTAGCAQEKEMVYTPTGKVYVLGEVARPGPIPYKPGMTLLDAVGQAGMYTKRAQIHNVRIVQKSSLPPRTVDVDLKDIMMNGAPNPILHENDIVYFRITFGGLIIEVVDDILSPLRSIFGAHQFATQQLPTVVQ